MWAALRETYGVMLASSDPIAKLLSAQPDLRGKTAPALAAHLGITLAQARTGIATFAAETFGRVPPGLDPDASLDMMTTASGTYHEPVELVHKGGMRTVPLAGFVNPFAHAYRKPGQ